MSQTKRVTHTAAFSTAAAASPEDALAFMLMQIFGVSLDAICSVVSRAITKKDEKVLLLCATAAGQIRGNVTFVGTSYGNVRAEYPELIIDSQRDVGDQFNFSALHVAGHVVLLASGNQLASKILSKVGNCVTGSAFPTNQAGKINSEIKGSWTPEELASFTLWLNALSPADKAYLDGLVASIATRSARFGQALAGRTSAKAATGSAKKEPTKEPAKEQAV